MVMNVGKIQSVGFKSNINDTKKVSNPSENIKITELSRVTPDFNVVTPQTYSKISVNTLPNGLQIHTYKLANGHTVSVIPMEDSPMTVKNYVNVGSMNETDDIKGISHFLEHMAFNGTIGDNGYMKLNRGDSFKKVEELGGWTNASTSYSITDYVNSTPMLEESELEKQIKIIAAMTENLALSEKMIEKEKSPVSSEIDMVLDSPVTTSIDQTIRTLFNIRSSADELIAGSVNHIQNLDRNKVFEYYNKYYTPDNMHLVITGDVEPQKVMDLVSKNFHSNKISKGAKFSEPLYPINHTVRKDFISDKASSTNITIGFEGPKNNDTKNAIIGEFIQRYFNSVEPGLNKELKKLNSYGELSNERISNNSAHPSFNFINIDCADEKSEEVLKLIFDKLSNLKTPSQKNLDNIKNTMIQDFNDNLEYSSFVNGIIGSTYFDDKADGFINYENIVKSITLEDIKNYTDKYLNIEKAAITVIHPDVDKSEVFNNYENAKNVNFKGKSHQPINPDKLSQTTLENNHKAGFVKTKNPNIPFYYTLYYDIPKEINPAAKYILDDIYSSGTMNMSEDDFRQFQEDNNISLFASAGKTSLAINGYSNMENFEKTTDKARELLYNPRITEEEFSDAVNRFKENLLLHQDNASDIYFDHEAETDSSYTKTSELIKSLEKLTIDDVKNLHKYILENSKGTICVNVPESNPDFKEKAIEEFSKFNNVDKYSYEIKDKYIENTEPVVLTKDRNVSQADIMQVYKFEIGDSDKELLVANLMNSLLSSSDSIGLFNSLRERDHLAYSVYSDLFVDNNCGRVSLNILTSTDNKETGTQTYDNVQKSINGFKRQINMLLNSEYTDEDLETAKRKMKASLLNNETVISKLSTIDYAIYKDKPLDIDNQKYKIIDSITREDIDNFAKKVFSKKPVYAIVASEDTLENNKDFLESLKQN